MLLCIRLPCLDSARLEFWSCPLFTVVSMLTGTQEVLQKRLRRERKRHLKWKRKPASALLYIKDKRKGSVPV